MSRKHGLAALTRKARTATPHVEGWIPEAMKWYEQHRAVFSGTNDVELLRGGDQLFPSMIEAIGRARRQVWLATYIFHDDAAGSSVVDALCNAAKRGVDVRVVIDGFGSKSSCSALDARFRQAGIDLAIFSPVGRWWNELKPNSLRRLHQKLCVVDSKVAFVGGINIIDDRIDLRHGVSEVPRFDFAVRMTGPVVPPVEYTARAVWFRARFGRDWRSEIADVARSSKPVVHAKQLLRQASMKPPESSDDHAPRAIQRHAASLPPMCAAFVVRDNLRQRRTIERSYIEAIRNARERVDIVCPYFYPGRAFRRVLDNAASRGVKVRLLLQGKLDYRFAGLAASVLYDDLLAGGVQIFEYTPAFLHAKVALVDRHWATVGSSNIDPLSLLLNLEANVLVEDEGFVQQLADEIDVAIAASRAVAPRKTHHRGWRTRFQRSFVAWCAHAYLRLAGSAAGQY